MKNRWIGALLTLPIAVLGSEAAYRIAQPSTRPLASENCLVLALGAPSRPDGTASTLQRFRVEAAVDTLRQRRCRGLLLTGGAVRNDRIEAVTMANLARTLGVRADQMVIEPSARTTWENVGCLHGWLRRAERVFVVSDTLHAQRAVRYACRQDSRLCGTVVNAGVVPSIGQLWWSLPAAAWQGAAFLRDRIVFERNPAVNAPLCSSVKKPEQARCGPGRRTDQPASAHRCHLGLPQRSRPSQPGPEDSSWYRRSPCWCRRGCFPVRLPTHPAGVQLSGRRKVCMTCQQGWAPEAA